MPSNSAEYQRLYRERQKREKAALAATTVSSSDPRKVGTPTPPYNVHAACDEKIADLERRLAECITAGTGPLFAAVRVSTEPSPSPEAFAGLPERRDHPKPGFLAAPDDDCPTCHHDRHASNHVYGVCQFKVAARTKCGCADFDLGFE